MVILVTGKPGAGKTTHAKKLADELLVNGHAVALFDGDAIRQQNDDRDFSFKGRENHLLGIAIQVRQLQEHRPETVCIVAVVAPRTEWRDMMRAKWKTSRLVYLPGGSLWAGTDYEVPLEREFHVYS